jgi:indolepyruvate ferredoxin oxidoreductase beta subunit
MNNTINIILTGVGGQGVRTAAHLLGDAALKAKINVYSSEIHGLSQRGGSINCSVRMGNISSPMIAYGTADVIVSLEPLEGLRNIVYAHEKTKVITDVNPLLPSVSLINCEKYPCVIDIINELQSKTVVYQFDALSIAKKSGSYISKNIVMLGALSALNVLPFRSNFILEKILDNSSSSFKDINRRAFNGGVKKMKLLIDV